MEIVILIHFHITRQDSSIFIGVRFGVEKLRTIIVCGIIRGSLFLGTTYGNLVMKFSDHVKCTHFKRAVNECLVEINDDAHLVRVFWTNLLKQRIIN